LWSLPQEARKKLTQLALTPGGGLATHGAASLVLVEKPRQLGKTPGWVSVISTAIGDRLRDARLRAGLSQRELSEPGVSYAYISRIEAGVRTPSIKVLRKLAPKLGVSVAWLETGKDDPAEELAKIVLESNGGTLDPRARQLARRVLELRS
jgi:transcriptional regulator with XRE-family HTH domain